MLFPFLQQFVAPVFQLRGDGFNVAGLFDASGFDVRGILVAQFSVRQLRHGMSGVLVDALAEHLEHFNGGA
jgi:hypothetical protein